MNASMFVSFAIIKPHFVATPVASNTSVQKLCFPARNLRTTMSANPDPNVNVNLNPNPQVQNIFKLPDPLNTAAEIFEPLVPPNSSPSSISSVPLIERIISTGQVTTPADYWYDSDKEEFVVVLQGSAQLKYDDENGPVVSLQAGDYVTIPAHKKHRVVFTSEDPPCVWLAVHYPR